MSHNSGDSPSVTVLVPIRNEAVYIERSLEAVLVQRRSDQTEV